MEASRPQGFGWIVIFFSIILLVAVSAAEQANQELSNVKKVYIEKMENNLDQYITSEISKQFHGTLQVTLDRPQADAIMKGVNIAAQDTTIATVQLVDPSGKSILWSGTGDDKDKLLLSLKHGGEQVLAAHLMRDLKRAMQPK